jgi:3-hydroxyacyl-CoA dehydrogenase
MFVFKVGVVGSPGIAEAVEAAGIPVVLDGGFGDVDLVIEAVADEIERKHEVFAELDARTPGHAILATTTARLSITEIGESTLRPDKVVGLHFVNGTRLVEVVESDDTSPETVQVAAGFVQSLRRTAIRCVECPGFVFNRIRYAASDGELDDPELARLLRQAYGDRFPLP